MQRDQGELVLAELLELAPGGLEETDVGEGLVEYALYGAPGELPALPRLQAAAGEALVEVSSEEVGEGWETRWRDFHRPLLIGPELLVRPPWSPSADTLHDVVIDPGQAFGTGAHATTRLCLELLLELDDPGGPFLDLGCGSGVLAILAAKLGYQPVTALDYDTAAIQAAEENAQRNGVTVKVRRHDLRTDPFPGGRTVAANLLAPLLRTLARRLEEAPELPRRLMVSGILDRERAEVAEAFAARGLRERKARSADGWTALLLERAA